MILGREPIVENVIYPSAGLMVCMEKFDVCSDIVVRFNIIAGVFHAGFGLDGFQCGAEETEQNPLSIYGNVAHSVEGDGFVVVNFVRD